jgi:hypothetical protein
MLRHSPRAFPWEKHLPWALVRVRESTAARPEGADRARGIACAKVVGASISRGVGTSATARIRNAGGRSTAGKRRGGKPDIASTPTSKPGTPRLRKSAAGERSPRLRLLRTQRLRQRVVTRQKFFFHSVMRSAGLPRPPCELAPQPRALLRPCLPASCSQCPGSGTQVALPQHLGWAEEAGHRVPSRASTPRFLPRPHPSSGTVAATSAVTGFPRPRRSSIIASPSSALVCWSR